MLKIYPAETDKDREIVKGLFTEYADCIFELVRPHSLSLAKRLSEKALKEAICLPGEYAEPQGCILLAEYEGAIAGCIAVSEIAEGVCEFKRIYVKPQFRRMGIGRELSDKIIGKAGQLLYKRMCLHTNDELFIGAKELYKLLGFKETGHIKGSPLKNSVQMELELG